MFCVFQGEKGVDGRIGEIGDKGKKGDRGMKVRLTELAVISCLDICMLYTSLCMD